MDIQTKEIYSEVYSVLNMLGNQYISKLPSKLYLFIEQERLMSYNPKYNEKDFKNQKIKRETISMIALLHLNYWCKTEDEKGQLRKMFKTNSQKNEVKRREKYNSENIFESKKHSRIQKNNEEANTKEVAIVKYRESIWAKLKNKLKKFLNFL